MGVCMLIVASIGVGTPSYKMGEEGVLIPWDDKVKGTKSRPVAYGIAVLFFLFSFFCKLSSSIQISHYANKFLSQTSHPGAQQHGFGHPKSFL